VGVSLVDLIKRVETLEAELDGAKDQLLQPSNGKPHLHAPVDGTWMGEDFSI
jgi:hypothetical protein